jgi:hypothetical protein
MEDSSPLPQKEKKKRTLGRWVSLLCKILFAIAALVLITITIMFNLGGKSDYLKETLESYATQITGYPAKIGKLNASTFYPDLGFDFENLELRHRPEDAIPIATIEHTQLFFNFWDATLGTGRIKSFNIENLKAMPGALTAQALDIKRAGIFREGDKAGTLRIEGKMNDEEIFAEAGMQAETRFISGHGYQFGNDNPVSIEIGNLHIEGRIGNTEDAIIFNNLKATLDKNDVGVLDITLTRAELGNLKMLGTVTISENGTILKPDLLVKDREQGLSVSGKIASPAFHSKDFDAGSRLLKFADKINTIIGTQPNSSYGHNLFFRDLELEIIIDEYHEAGQSKGSLSKDIELESTMFSIRPESDFVSAFKNAPVNP